ncbi:MAG: hypothetical protein EBV03_09495 [Proteobacteria bacterium]|nr:hypothetical protein [Pseudomonadota bacterium]
MAKMQFPKAGDYFKTNPTITVRDTAIDSSAELPIFHFGQQPRGFKDIDKNAVNGGDRKIAVIGCGSAYNIFSSTALKQRGTQCYIIDTADKEVLEKRLGRKLDPKREIKIGSMDELPADVEYVAILTPPEHHAGEIRKLQARGTPTMVEKPLVCMGEHLVGAGHLDEKLEQNGKAPLYCMDWEVLLATPLMSALGMKPSFEGIVEYGPGGRDAFKAFDLNGVTKIETTFVEGGTNPLAGKQDRGGWLWDISKGGGGLYDMGVHALNAIAALGFMPEADKIGDVALGAPNFNGTKGIYQAIGANSLEPEHGNRPAAEMYARAHLQSRFNGRSIPTMLECGKGGYENDMRITMTDKSGHVLNWEYGPDKSVVTLKNAEGAVLGTAQSHIDPYALMYEEATRFFEREKAAKAADPARYKPTALYYHEHKGVLLALDAIQKKGRSADVAPNAEVRQLIVDAQRAAPPTPFTERVPQPRADVTKPDGTGWAKKTSNPA